MWTNSYVIGPSTFELEKIQIFYHWAEGIIKYQFSCCRKFMIIYFKKIMIKWKYFKTLKWAHEKNNKYSKKKSCKKRFTSLNKQIFQQILWR